jgi:hypothetical protein
VLATGDSEIETRGVLATEDNGIEQGHEPASRGSGKRPDARPIAGGPADLGREQEDEPASRDEAGAETSRRGTRHGGGSGGSGQRTGGYESPNLGSDTMLGLGIDKLYFLGAKGHNI